MPTIDKPLTQVFVHCLSYYRSNNRFGHQRIYNRHIYSKLEEMVKDALCGMAKVHAVNFPGFSVDVDNPGYLCYIDLPVFLRVPYFVLPAIPTSRELSTLWTLSRSLKSTFDSVICLSGSTVLKGILEEPVDIDFFEYNYLDSTKKSNFFDRNMSYRNSNGNKVICVSVKQGDNQYDLASPTEAPDIDKLLRYIRPKDPEFSTIKFDYICDLDVFGVTKVTNIALFIEDENTDPINVTFPYQEALLDPADILPNRMTSPFELGRYMDYLLFSITSKLGDKEYLKCLKRCASLSRLLFLSDFTESIMSIVKEYRPTILYMKKLDKELLRSWVESSEINNGNEIIKKLDVQINEIKKEIDFSRGSDNVSDFMEQFRGTVTHLAENLAEQVESMQCRAETSATFWSAK